MRSLPKKKKKEDLTSISEKVNIRYTFDEKKSEHQFQNFWPILTRFEEISEILAKLSKFSLFFQILSKISKINKKFLVNPMNFVFESRNLNSRAESV